MENAPSLLIRVTMLPRGPKNKQGNSSGKETKIMFLVVITCRISDNKILYYYYVHLMEGHGIIHGN